MRGTGEVWLIRCTKSRSSPTRPSWAQSPRTPLIVLGGVSVVVLSVVAILLVVAFLAYYLS